MAVTTSLGVGSGIDIAGTVSQLTAAEGKPQLDAIAAKVNVSQTKLSGLGTLKGALSTFQNAVKMLDKSTTFQSQVITSSDEKVLKVSVDPSATAAAHTVKVNTLATAQRSVSTSEFKSTDVVNEGVLIFNDSTGAPKFSAIITKGTNDTLAGVRDAINNAKGNNSVVASLVNVDSKTTPGTTVSKLVLTAKTAGTANAFSVDTSLGDVRFNLNSVDTPANFNTTVATDTNVIIDAQPIAATSQRSIANKEFTSTDVVAPGMISFKDAAGVEKFSVNIIKGNNDKIFAAMDAINSNPANTIVTASVINVESKTTPGTSISKLVFTSKQPGVENKFSMDASKGDPLFTLDSSPANAQKSVASTVFSDTDLVAPGVLTIKDATGTAKFSVTIAADTTATLNADGTALAVGADGNPVLTDADGNPIPTITSTIKGNNTLADLRDAINYNPENKLVVASIVTTTIDAVTTDSGTLDANGKPIMTVVTPASTTSKLVLTALEAGTDKGFAIDATAGDTRFALDPKVPSDPAVPATFVSSTTEATFDTTPAMAANDGGQSVTRTSNTISDAIPGVTLTLLTTGTATIDAHLDTPSIAQPINGFVDAYNKLNATLQQLTNYVGPGNVNNGALLGDSTLQSIISQIKLTINSTVSSATGDYNSLNQLGVSFDKKGVMSLDSTKLNAALAGNLTSVANVFASTNGVATQLNTKITQYLDSKGALSTQQDSLNKTLTQLTTDKAAVNARLAATQKTLQAQYIAMDTAVSQFKNTGTFLTQALTPKTTA
jgi:flagellar hook-associated protein 2